MVPTVKYKKKKKKADSAFFVCVCLWVGVVEATDLPPYSKQTIVDMKMVTLFFYCCYL